MLGFWIFRRVDFVWLLMSNSELLRIKNKQKTTYKKQKTASCYKKRHKNGLMTDLGLRVTDILVKVSVANGSL